MWQLKTEIKKKLKADIEERVTLDWSLTASPVQEPSTAVQYLSCKATVKNIGNSADILDWENSHVHAALLRDHSDKGPVFSKKWQETCFIIWRGEPPPS